MRLPAQYLTGVLTVLVLQAACSLSAQSILTNYRHYRMSDGLPSEKVSCLYEAPDGRLWMGTNAGLCHFDGMVFTTFPRDSASVPVQTITALHSSNDTLLFIGTLRGLAVHDLRSGRFENARIKDPLLRIGTGQEIMGFAPLPKGNLLVVAGEYLAVLDRRGNTLRIRRSVQDLNASVKLSTPPAFVDADSTVMLVQMMHAGFYQLDLATLDLQPAPAPFNERHVAGYTNDSYIDAYRLPGGTRMLYGAYWGHYLYSDPQRAVRIEYPFPPAQPGGLPAHPARLVRDRSDTTIFWLASHYGLRRFSDRTLSFDTYLLSGSGTDINSINVLNDLVIDRHGQKWLATNAGLVKLAKLTWRFEDLGFKDRPGFRDASFGNAITDATGRLWVASFDRGIYRLEPGRDPGQVADWRLGPGNEAHITFDLRRIDGISYAATNRGIQRYDDASGHFEDTGWIPDSLLNKGASAVCVHRDRQGDWWFGVGAGGGLVRMHADGRRTVYNHYHRTPGTSEYLPIRYPWVIAEDTQGDLWMGLPRNEGMLVRWRRDAERFDTVRVRLGDVELLRVPITDLRFDAGGNLWATSYSHGVLRRDAGTGAWTQFDMRHGLRSNDITCSAFDVHGNLWVGTHNGFAVLLRGTERFRAFTLEDGLPHAVVHWLGFPFADRPGRLVLTGKGHVHAVDVTLLLEPEQPLRVVLERITVEGEPCNEPAGHRFGHDRSHFEFFFHTVDLVNGPDDRYSYRLDGIDADWVEAGNRRSANYANVPPGRYVFHVRVGNSSTGWSEPASYAFVVMAPVWKRWWFYVLVLCVVAAIVYLVYRARIDRLLAMERVRSNISRDLHDDIGSTLSSISLLAHATRSRLKQSDPQGVEESLEKIGDRTRRMLDNMRDIIWSIKPENDALPNVLARMRDYASSALEPQGIDADIDFPNGEGKVQLPLELKNNLYLVFKEAVNNLAKYSGATRARIVLTLQERTLRLLVEDNGSGFDPAVVQRGNGLNNMERRAQESGARLSVTSTPGHGTRVEFEVPRIP